MAKKQSSNEETTDNKPKRKTSKINHVDFSNVSQSTEKVIFEWSSGDKSGTKESMSENVAEIMELKGLGKKVK